MLKINKQALAKGFYLTQDNISENEILISGKVKIGRIYQDHFQLLTVFNKESFKNIKEYVRSALGIDLEEKDYLKLVKQDYDWREVTLKIYKVEFILFGGGIWNLLDCR